MTKYAAISLDSIDGQLRAIEDAIIHLENANDLEALKEVIRSMLLIQRSIVHDNVIPD